MSSGVPDQMKVPGNAAKSVDRSIPWTQPVVDLSYDNVSSVLNDNKLTAANPNSSMQFQYPPFNAKEAQTSWNNKSRRSTAQSSTYTHDLNKKYNKSANHNNKRDDYQTNAWGSNNSRRPNTDNTSGNFNRGNPYEVTYTVEKLDNRSNANNLPEAKKTITSTAAPKKTTWASIASQPAKLTSRATLTTSSHKKKGPGMPPPPMVPGKHNLDVNIWDLPNNNPPPVPSPPPQMDLGSSNINSHFLPGIGVDYDLNARQGNGFQFKGQDVVKDDNSKVDYGNSFGRSRSSPNGPNRKNWSSQTPQHQDQGNRQSAHIRRGEGALGGGASVGILDAGRYGERMGHYTQSQHDYDSVSYDRRDENSSRNVEFNDLVIETPHAVLEELRDKNNYNPAEIDLETAVSARFFVIKSYSEDDVHRSIKYEIWCSTDHGNKRLDDAFKERHKDGGKILLFFSVNGSGHFCGMAQMMTPVDYNSTSTVWSQDKWKGKFKVKWIYVKDVPNNQLRHITLENNENKPVTNSRDTQEVPNVKGVEVLRILHTYKHATSIFDDFYHYEKKQEEEVSSKNPSGVYDGPQVVRPHFNARQNEDRDKDGRGNGGATQKHFGSSSFKDRNTSYRGSYGGYNDRRFDSHRIGERGDRSSRADFKDIEGGHENDEYNNSSKQMSKYDYNKREDKMPSKHNNRDRDFQEEQHSKSESSRLRPGPRESQKDKEFSDADRIRSSDF